MRTSPSPHAADDAAATLHEGRTGNISNRAISGSFANAVASQCKAHGQGLETAIARKIARFTIEACDSEGRQLPHGGEKFNVMLSGSSVVRARVTDKEDGIYSVEYKTSSSGPYTISILLHGAPLPGSPFEMRVLMPRPDATQCTVRGDALEKAAARESMAFEVGFVDAHSHPTHAEELDVHVEALSDVDEADDSLERLIGTGAEASARRWAREWAIQRAAGLRRMDADLLHARLAKELKEEEERLEAERAEQAALDREAESPSSPGGRSPPSSPNSSFKKVGETEEVPKPTKGESQQGEQGQQRASLEPPIYKQLSTRIVGGPQGRPLIVRLGRGLDSEFTGSISVGSILQVTETEKFPDGSLRAFVLVDAPRAVRPRSPRPRSPGPGSPVPGSPHHRAPTSATLTVPPDSWVEQGEWPQRDDDAVLLETLDSSRLISGRSSVVFSPGRSMATGGDAWTDGNVASERSSRSRSMATVSFKRKRELGATAETADNPKSLVEALTDDVISCTCGWVTAIKDGKELLARPHEQLNSGLRRQHISLWEQRKAADRLISKGGIEAKDRALRGKNESSTAELLAGPSFAHELAGDPEGIGFAFGGVDPGTLHAHGQVVKHHTVKYSIGLAGRYRLHVGLRQQSVALPNSPFLLTVTPGNAHARSSHLPAEALPLQGNVGSPSDPPGCSIVVKLCDRMGNHCTSGGAELKCKTELRQTGSSSDDKDGSVSTQCEDMKDGSYHLVWQSQTSGTYSVSVTIAGVHLVGSPLDLLLSPGSPDVEKCSASGDGLSAATAGRPSQIILYCKDKFENVASRSSSISFGLVLLPRDSKDVVMGEEVKLKGADGVPAALQSMLFDASWTAEEQGYELLYTASEAGEFGLHIWLDLAKGQRKFFPGSPFAVRVSGVRAAAGGSYLAGTEQYEAAAADVSDPLSSAEASDSPGSAGSPSGSPRRASTPSRSRRSSMNSADKWSRMSRESREIVVQPTAKIVAGEPMQLWPRLHDEFGNASFAQEGELSATLAMPNGQTQDLPVKQMRELGRYELNYEPQKKGRYTLHVDLSGQGIQRSPFIFDVLAASALASKCKLLAPEQSPFVHSQCDLVLETYDKYGNRLDTGGSPIVARVVGQGVSTVDVTDRADGTYILSFTGAVAGECRVVVRLENTEMKPMTLAFVAADEAAAEAGAKKG